MDDFRYYDYIYEDQFNLELNKKNVNAAWNRQR